jgi:RNA polymerase sigma-70 factor (ECF subfamily)
MPSHSDLELLSRIGTDDPAALGVILERYWAPVVRFATGFLHSRDAAEDVAQETFVRLWERRDAWQQEGSLRALLFRITRNLSLDEIRRRSARERADKRASRPALRSTAAENVEHEELGNIIARAVDALPPRRRDVFVLVRYHGLSYREAAQVLDLAPQTVANHLSMALANLRDSLAPYFYGHIEKPPRDSAADLSA